MYIYVVDIFDPCCFCNGLLNYLRIIMIRYVYLLKLLTSSGLQKPVPKKNSVPELAKPDLR
jgi:hypothetical protein